MYGSEKPRRMIWQMFYEIVSFVNKDDDWITMNYGYALLSSDGKLLNDLKEDQDKKEIFSIQLYHYTASVLSEVTKMEGKTLVEVGSGRGGGLSFLTRNLKPKKAFGVDFSENQVEFCNRRHQIEGLKYLQGDAENLHLIKEIPEKSVDYIINVESSHCYGNIDKFFNGINRILKDDGMFFYTDFRGSKEMKELNDKLKEHFTVVNAENISHNVMHALKLDTER
jgi:ubiquinone/menaquinone biosynthesis C-methylase UbiE